MSTVPKPRLSLQEYLQIEEGADYKSEFLNGEIFAMSGGTPWHGVITVNAAALLRAQLRPKGCRVFSSDVRIAIPATGLYTYPDVSVVCGEPRFSPDDKNALVNPVVVVEVLSPATEAYDRGAKFGHYRNISSLAHYILIAADRIAVDVFTSTNDGWLLTAATQPRDMARLSTVGAELSLADLYADVEFDRQGSRHTG